MQFTGRVPSTLSFAVAVNVAGAPLADVAADGHVTRGRHNRRRRIVRARGQPVAAIGVHALVDVEAADVAVTGVILGAPTARPRPGRVFAARQPMAATVAHGALVHVLALCIRRAAEPRFASAGGAHARGLRLFSGSDGRRGRAEDETEAGNHGNAGEGLDKPTGCKGSRHMTLILAGSRLTAQAGQPTAGDRETAGIDRHSNDPTSVDDGVGRVFPLEMWNLELLHGLKRQLQRAFGRAASSILQFQTHPSQSPQDSRAVEPLTFTMIAEAHLDIVSRPDRAGFAMGPATRRVTADTSALASDCVFLYGLAGAAAVPGGRRSSRRRAWLRSWRGISRVHDARGADGLGESRRSEHRPHVGHRGSARRREAGCDEQPELPLHWTTASKGGTISSTSLCVRAARAAAGRFVLDFAAGTCWASELLSRSLCAPFIDLSVEMMRRGRARLRRIAALFSATRRRCGARGQSLPFADASFDGVL